MLNSSFRMESLIIVCMKLLDLYHIWPPTSSFNLDIGIPISPIPTSAPQSDMHHTIFHSDSPPKLSPPSIRRWRQSRPIKRRKRGSMPVKIECKSPPSSLPSSALEVDENWKDSKPPPSTTLSLCHLPPTLDSPLPCPSSPS
ncbi:unnamed protein product [Linum tenue]|uniref:Uncharacterized protein n=1 Tax=Linum tenue TaxID=586396 RepID=A0AAV0RM47_9ROSI|nr:unnamed protein product [Linum tenue]